MRGRERDRIDIVGLAVPAVIGILPGERRRRQRLVLDLSLEADLRRAARTDRIEDALDYARVGGRVREFVRGSRFFLLEAMAEETARLVLSEFPARSVTVRVEKPGALPGARTVAVTITRARRQRP